MAALASAVAEERARIAREMHDIVAHGMGVMVVQATAAEHLLDRVKARQPLRDMRQTGQESLAEMRRLLGLLRTGAGDVSGKARDLPTLAQVPDLVAQLNRRNARDVDDGRDSHRGRWHAARARPVRVPDRPGVVDQRPQARDWCRNWWRSVRLALRSSSHHHCWSREQGRPRCIPRGDVEIRSATGLGLIGMRERAAVYGGTLVASHSRIPASWYARSCRYPDDRRAGCNLGPPGR